MKSRRMADPHAGLLRHLKTRLHREGMTAELRASHSERWASATFTGARHRFQFCAVEGGMDLNRMARDLGETEFALPDHIVADITLINQARGPDGLRFEVEALTVEAS